MNVMEKWTSFTKSLFSLHTGVISIYLFGLLLYSYPPLILYSSNTRIFRVDWLLSLPLLFYFFTVRKEIVLTRTVLAAFSFISVVAVGSLLSGFPGAFDFLTAFFQLLYAVGLFTVLISFRLSSEEFASILRFWILLLVAVSIYGIYQALALNIGLPLSDPTFGIKSPINYETFGYVRPASLFGEPSFFSSALLTGYAVLIPCVAAKRDILFSRRNQILALLILVGAIFASGSISGILVLAVSGLFFIAIPDTRRFALQVIGGGVPLTVFVILASQIIGISLISAVLIRFDTIISVLVGTIPPGGGSVYVRYARSLAGIKTGLQAPVFGTGIGQYAAWAAEQNFVEIRRWLVTGKPLTRIHGGWVQVFATTGITGLFAFAATWLSAVLAEIRTAFSLSGSNRVLCVAGLSLTLVQMIHWAIGYSMLHPYRWALIGLCLSYVASHTDLNTR